jgi:hypothetical protein
VNKVMKQRLTRGTPVIVADSFGQAKLRGKSRIVTSKGPVKCNKGGRCAGDWCVGLAVFVADPKSAKKDKKMGWRANTTKICLTHLKDEGGVLVLPPPLLRQEPEQPLRLLAEHAQRFEGLEVSDPEDVGSSSVGEVTWADLAEAHRAGDLNRLALLARQLKSQTEGLKSKVIATQGRLIESLTGE